MKRNSLEGKIEEEEVEDDEEEKLKAKPKPTVEKTEASENIAKLINAKELKEEENRVNKWISQIQESRSRANSFKGAPIDGSNALTKSQLQTKLKQAEGDTLDKKSVLIVKEGRTSPKGNDDSSLSLTRRNGSNPISARGSVQAAVTPPSGGLNKTPSNKKSFFSRFSPNSEEPPQRSLRKALTIKMVKSSEERQSVKPLAKRNFETPKAETTRIERPQSSLVLDNENEEKIDIVEIPTNVIQNFTQKLHRMNSRDISAKKKQNAENNDIEETPKEIKQLPNKKINENEEGATDDNFSPEGASPKDEEMSFAAHQRAKILKGRRRHQTVVVSPYKSFDPNIETSTPTKIVVVDGTILNKKERENVKKLSLPAKQFQVTTPKSTISNDEDEIPGIAFCVAGQDEKNKKYRLSIYNAPKTENEAGQVLKSLWGNANMEAMKNDSDLTNGSNADKEYEEDDPERKDEENKEYKIRVISPSNSLKIKRASSEKETPNFGKVFEASEQTNRISDFQFKIPELKKSIFSKKPQGNEVKKSEEFQPFDSPKKEENEKIHAFQSNIPLLEVNKPLNKSPKRKFIKQKSLENLTKQSIDKDKPKPQRPEIPLLKLEETEMSPDMSPITKISFGNEISSNYNESEMEISNNDLLHTPQQFNSNLNSVAFFEHKPVINIQQREEENQETISLTKYSESNDTPFKKILEPSPTMFSDISWKKQGENNSPEPIIEESQSGRTENFKKIVINYSPEEEEKAKEKKKSKKDKYKIKYKQQKQFIKELLHNFQEVKQENEELLNGVSSIHERLDNFEKMMDNLQKVIVNFATKYKEEKEKKATQQKESQLPKTHVEDLSAIGSHISRDDNYTSTIYLPQKKTIVFSFQKPPSSVRENTLEQLKDTSIEVNSLKEFEKQNEKIEDESSPNLMLSVGSERQKLIKEPDSNVMKPMVRRVPKLKGEEGSKSGFQKLKADLKYKNEEEKSGFLDDSDDE